MACRRSARELIWSTTARQRGRIERPRQRDLLVTVWLIGALLAALLAAPPAIASCDGCSCNDGACVVTGCCGGNGQRCCVPSDDSIFSNCDGRCGAGLECDGFTCRTACSYCRDTGICCGAQGQTACVTVCSPCAPGLEYDSSKGTCQPPCGFCRSPFGNCCGDLGQVSCAFSCPQHPGLECEPGLRFDTNKATCQEFDPDCHCCQAPLGFCCGDDGELSCGITGKSPQGNCDTGCCEGFCYKASEFVCKACCSRDDAFYFSSGPCGKSYERACALIPDCDDGYRFDLDQNGFDGTDLCQPTWRAPQRTIPAQGDLDFTFLVIGDVHVSDSRRGICSPTSAYPVMTKMVNTVGSSGLTWPDTTDANGQYLYSNHGLAIGDPYAIVTTGDMTNYGAGQSDLLQYSKERRTMQDFWDERRGRDEDCTDGEDTRNSVNFPVYVGFGNHDRVACEARPDRYFLVRDHLFEPDWWNDLQCEVRASLKNNVMRDYITGRMQGHSGINFDAASQNYSWDWGPVHLIQGNTWVGEGDFADPEDSDLDWLRNDLAMHVGTSGRPVILFQHYGWDSFSEEVNPENGRPYWWSAANRAELRDALRGYNVAAVFTGHSHQENFIAASNPDGPGFDVYTTDDGGDDDRCSSQIRPTHCTDDQNCNDFFSGTTDKCVNSTCEYSDAGNGRIKGDGGITIVRVARVDACELRMEVAQFSWEEGLTAASQMHFEPPGELGDGVMSPSSVKQINLCNRPPVARCAGRNVAADAFCAATVSIDDGSSDPDGPAPTCVASPPAPYPLGTTFVALTCTDAAQASDICHANVTVVDQSPPALTCPTDQTYECTGDRSAAASFTAMAEDNCTAGPAVACAPPSESLFGLGSNAVVCSAQDAAGNSADCTFTVAVQDTMAPSLTCPPAQTVECSGERSATIDYTATASDACWGALSPTCTPPPGSRFPIGTTSLACAVADGSGHPVGCSAAMTVVDTTRPTVSCAIAGEGIIWPPNQQLVNANFTAGAADACYGSLPVAVSVFSNLDDAPGPWSHDASPDAVDIAPGTLRLRAERLEQDPAGRVYLMVTHATDSSGNIGTACCTSVVPHSNSSKHRAAAQSAANVARSYCLANGGAVPAGYTRVGEVQ